MHPYLEALQTKYDQLRGSVEGLQQRAVDEKRDLTDVELRSVKEQGEQMKMLAEQIADLADIETRSASVADAAAKIAAATGTSVDKPDDAKGGDTQTRSAGTRLGTTSTKDRDPGHYLRSGSNSFFGDIYKSRVFQDELAGQRLREHSRALSTGDQGVGVVPPKWLTEEFETLARQGRRLANAVRYIPLGDDPRPMSLPKQTAGTDDVVAEQAAESDPVDGEDAYDSDVAVVTPKPTAGKQVVSRQMVDMSNPAIDLLIYGDLMGVYNVKVEKKVGAAMIASAGTAVTTFATEAAFLGTLPAVPAHDAVVDTSIAVWEGRHEPADLIAMTVRRWGKFKKLKDADGRPLIPSNTAGPMNVIGVGEVQMAGQLEELGVIPTIGIGDGVTYPESTIVARGADTLLFESNILRFRFEEVAGPEDIVLGIWGYTAVHVKYAGKSVTRFVVTAAS
jgi:HK97 family phage major capsid protein